MVESAEEASLIVLDFSDAELEEVTGVGFRISGGIVPLEETRVFSQQDRLIVLRPKNSLISGNGVVQFTAHPFSSIPRSKIHVLRGAAALHRIARSHIALRD